MWKVLVLCVGFATGTAHAADSGSSSTDAPDAEPIMEASLTSDGPFGGGGRGPVETIEDEVKEKKSKQQLEEDARLQAIEDARKNRAGRVIVLKVKDTDTDYRSEALIRNVKNRIARPDARFYPEIDLFQSGRREPDKTLRPADQRAMVPDDAVDEILDAVDDVSTIPWNAMSEQDWGLRANELRNLAELIWFVDKPEFREALFLLYAQIGNAAENANQGTAPYFEYISNQNINYYWYLAGAMAKRDPSLLSKLTDQDLNASITNYKDMLDSGRFNMMTLSFDQDDNYDANAFTKDFKLYVNGLEEIITNPDGLLKVPLGRADIYLERPADKSHSLSNRIELLRADEDFIFIMNDARKKMGLDFHDQLMENPYQCTPTIDGDILTYLSIYAKLHDGADIYIVVPEGGSTAPGKLHVWRWDRQKAILIRIQDNTGGFPVRFAALLNTGLAFASIGIDESQLEGTGTGINQTTATNPDPASAVDGTLPTPKLAPDGIPVEYQLRGHYNRLIMIAGFALRFPLGRSGDGAPYEDLYPVDSNKSDPRHSVVEFRDDLPCEGAGDPVPECTDGTSSYGSLVTAYRERKLQRFIYTGLGVMLGRDAAVGFGPRGYIRFGWYNAPHALDFTGHAGYTAKVFGGDKRKEAKQSGRVRMIVDVDLFGGVMAPFGTTSYKLADNDGFAALGKPLPTFGFTFGAGLTF